MIDNTEVTHWTVEPIWNRDRRLFIERLASFKRETRDAWHGGIESVPRVNAVHEQRVICT